MNTYFQISSFGPRPPEFDLYYAAVDKQTGQTVALGMSAPGVLADASERTGLPKDYLELRKISGEEYERFKSIGIQEKREPDNTCNPAPAKPFTV
jgi:hypothetical protein